MVDERPASPQIDSAATLRAWLPLLTILFVVAVLGAMLVVPRLAAREASERRAEITLKLQPFEDALQTYRFDILRVSSEVRAYAATRNPPSLARFLAADARLVAQAPELRTLAEKAGFRPGTDEVIVLADDYREVAGRIVAAEDANNDFESFRLIDQEGSPKLVEIDRVGTDLVADIGLRRDDLRNAIGEVEDREQLVLLFAAGLGALAAVILGATVINNVRLARQVDEQSRRLDGIISDVPGVVWEAWGRPDAATQRIDYVSPFVEEMLGYTREEWLGTPNFWRTIVHPDDREAAAAEAAANFARGGKGVNRFRWIAKDGRVIHVLANSTVINDEVGLPAGMRGVTVDLTEQRRTEAALERERARFASISASIDYGVYQTDEEGHLVYLNPAGEELLGYTMEELLDREPHSAFHQTRNDGTPYPEDECPICPTSQEGVTYRGVETFTSRAGRKIPVEVACAAVVVDGRATGAVVVFQDISARLRQEQLRDDFVGFASHELRNPLTSIKGFSSWLASRAEAQPAAFDADARDAIHTLVDEADRMESIINLFLDLARIDSNRMAMELEPVNLSRVLDEECERLRTRYPAAVCDTSLPATAVIAMLDDDRVRQVLGNLLDNAAKYAGDAAHVTVTLAEEEPGWATVRVKDNGPGIPAADQPFLFDRYYRGRQAQSAPRKGLGVGLFITKNLVDLMGGELAFTSGAGDGTEFVLRLPLAALEEDDVPEPPTGSAP